MWYWISPLLTRGLVVSCCLATGCHFEPAATVRLQQAVVDLGEVSENTQPEATVVVVNETDQPVRASELILSCGCLGSDFEPTTIEPGQELTSTVTLLEPSPGKSTQYGQFVLDNGPTKTLEFELNYHVVETSYLYPQTQILGAIRVAESTWPREVSFQIRGLTESVKLLEPLIVEGETLFQYKVKDATFAPDGNVKLAMSRQDELFGVFHDRIEIIANTTEGQQRYPVTISGSLLGDP